MKKTLVALSAISLIALSGCTIPTPATPEAVSASNSAGQTAGGASLGIEAGAGPAPQAITSTGFVRANEVRNSDGVVTVGLSLGTLKYRATINDRRVTVTTDTGVTVPLSFATDLTVREHALAALTLSVPRPAANVRQLTIDLHDVKVTVPVPGDGRAIAWPSAPLRQTALAAAPLRFSDAEVTVQTVRTEGLFTEVTFAAQGLHGYESQIVSENVATTNPWEIVEPDGTSHPALPGPADMQHTNGRVHGTVRFVGEIAPNTTTLTLKARAGSWLNSVQPVTVELPSPADSPIQPAAGDLTRPTVTTPIKLTTKDGLTATVDRVDVLSDSIQVHTVFQGSPRWDLVFSRTDTTVTDSAGVVHEMLDGNRTEFRIPRDGKLDATLVFAGAPDASVTSLQLNFAATMAGFTGTVPIPAAPAAQPVKGTTFAEVGQIPSPAMPAAHTTPLPLPTSTAASATPVPGTLSLEQITDLPRSVELASGSVFSSVQGHDTGAQNVSSAGVAAQADAAAQRSLRDLGAQKTPDGYVLTLPETVLFDYNAADVKPGAAATLDKVAKLLAYYDKVKIGVNGHTDNTGEAAYNLDLSKRRAQAVADALKGKGVAASRMTVEGFGVTKPVASNNDDAGKAKNRRVEIVLRENA